MDIDTFLGEEILTNPILSSKKLNNEEKNIVERDIELNELETALETYNLSSAPGLDGFNNRTLKKIELSVRYPILTGLKTMNEKGELIETFRLGGI